MTTRGVRPEMTERGVRVLRNLSFLDRRGSLLGRCRRQRRCSARLLRLSIGAGRLGGRRGGGVAAPPLPGGGGFFAGWGAGRPALTRRVDCLEAREWGTIATAASPAPAVDGGP